MKCGGIGDIKTHQMRPILDKEKLNQEKIN